jgi:hypothetical protein
MGGGRDIVYGPDPRWGFGNRQPLWPCLAGVSRWFDGFGGREGRSALYILATEHGLMGPWQGWCGIGALMAGGLEDPQWGHVAMCCL